VCKKLIKNSQRFGKKLSENRRGDFLTHTVYTGWAKLSDTTLHFCL